MLTLVASFRRIKDKGGKPRSSWAPSQLRLSESGDNSRSAPGLRERFSGADALRTTESFKDFRSKLALEQVDLFCYVRHAEVWCEAGMLLGDSLVHLPGDATVGEVALRG